MPTEGYDPRKHGVSFSMMADFLECRQKARFRAQGVQSLMPSLAISFGSLGHDVLEQAHDEIKSGRLPEGKLPGRKRIARWVRTAESNWQKQNRLASTKATQQVELCCAYLEALMYHYFRYWAAELFEMDWIEVESWFRFEMRISGQNELFVPGKRDGAYRLAKKKKRVYLWEAKFQSRISEDQILEAVPISLQNNIYLLALEQELGFTPKGVTYNVVRRPGQRQKDNEPTDEFIERVSADIKKRPEHYFHRFRITADKDEMEKTKADLQGILNEFIHWWEGRRMHYRNTTACQNKYGLCWYLPICANNDWSLFRKKERGKK